MFKKLTGLLQIKEIDENNGFLTHNQTKNKNKNKKQKKRKIISPI